MSTECKVLYIWNHQKVDSKDPHGLDVGTNAPLATGLVNARTGVLTQLGQVLQEATQGQENKCLHLVLLRFFGWGVKSCYAHYISISKYQMSKVRDARTLPRWKPPWRRWLKLGLVWSLFLLGHLRLSRDQTLLSLFFSYNLRISYYLATRARLIGWKRLIVSWTCFSTRWKVTS